MTLQEEIKNTIRTIEDFPKAGISFKDISPVIESPELSNRIVDYLKTIAKPLNLDAIVGIESRGFIYGMPLALSLNIPFILVRKKGKLPYKTNEYSYDLEYGSATIEMHQDSLKPNWNVLIHDDLLATGGTAAAAAQLVKMQNANVTGFSFLVELSQLEGQKKLLSFSENITNIVSY